MNTESLSDVIIVDDDKYIRDSLRELMSKWRINTEEAEDGVVAIKKLKNKHYSLILLDMKMNNKDGLDVLNEMKKLHITTPVIMITAYMHDERVKEALKHNMGLCLMKPISPADLKKTVKSFIHFPDA